MRRWDKAHRLNLTKAYALVGALVGALVTLLAAPVAAGMAQEPAATASAQTVAAGAGAAPKTGAQADNRYRIGPGDVLEIRVFNRPQLSLEAMRVDASGMIRIPLVEEDIHAACQTEIELAKEIATRYRKYQRNPQVFVFVKEYNSQPVAVIGAVEKPGRFQLQRRIRLLEMISFVGGPSDKAGTRVQVAHMGGGPTCDSSGKLFTLKEGSKEGKESEEELGDFEVYSLAETMEGDFKANPYIQPGDIITIPEADQAFVIGNVYKPSPVLFKTEVTVSRAIAMAGGVLPDSNTNRIRIIRQEPGTRSKTELYVSLRAISQQQAEDLPLQPGDIVEVGTLSGRRILRSILTGAAPALASLPIYVLR